MNRSLTVDTKYESMFIYGEENIMNRKKLSEISVDKFFYTILLMVSLLVFTALSGCGGAGKTSGNETGTVESTGKGTDSGVRISAEEAAAAKGFLSKVNIKEGVGSYELSAEKLRDGAADFVLRVKNTNGFPAAAMITCSVLDTDGNVLAAASQDTAVMVEGAQDILVFSFDDLLFSGGYDSIELCAYAREKTVNTVMMIDNYPASKVKVTTGKTVKGGAYNGWHQIDVKVNGSDSSTGDVKVLYYDADDYLIACESVWTRDNDFYTYFKDDFDHCEVMADKLVEGARGLPESIYEEYRKNGYETVTDGSKTYSSPDGSVEYDFFKAKDGTILLHAVNVTARNITWYVNDTIVYSGSRNGGTSYLDLRPKEELLWDLGFENDTEFWLMEPVAYEGNEKEIAEPKVSIHDAEGGKEISADMTEIMNDPDFGTFNTLDCKATVVCYKGGETVSAECIFFNEELIYYKHHDEEKLGFSGDYDTYEIYVQYEPMQHMEPGY